MQIFESKFYTLYYSICKSDFYNYKTEAYFALILRLLFIM